MLTVPKLPPYKGKDPATKSLWAASNAEASLADRFRAAGIQNWNTSKASRTVCNVLIIEYRDAQLDAGNSAAADDHTILQLALDGYGDASVLGAIDWGLLASAVAYTPLFPPAVILALGPYAKVAYFEKLAGTIQAKNGFSDTLPDALSRLAKVDAEAAALIAVEAGENIKGIASDVYQAKLVELSKIPGKAVQYIFDKAKDLAGGAGDLLFWLGAAAVVGLGAGLYQRSKGK
jgi:hypothetical protein